MVFEELVPGRAVSAKRGCKLRFLVKGRTPTNLFIESHVEALGCGHVTYLTWQLVS